ncbi:serine/threonine-protein phosphatase 6 regulatory ankyrin repeat subunit C-like [Papaver somniferum]|uniref:serine/threonine-protein phosphatase 6 regulatory ankyrin repeat subunit C-like n=1 Tax=Papaver somniferum TaxID=3469 RepID=UPI000E6F8BA5|nr:serine/threonine-protein phosphatase 6 regulatory ankyrin repeat subunit C-like [Papaver somniferum]
MGVGLPTILGNIRNEDGRRALHIAAAGGRLDVLKYLIEDMKLNIDVQDNSGETPMCCAAIEGRLSTVAYLLKMGANPEIPNGTAMIPYLLKVMGDNPEIPNGTDIPMNPLHHAAAEGNHDIITLLLSKGVNVDVSNGFGSPLLHACAVGRHDTVKLLLDHNANPNWLFGEATTPLRDPFIPNLGNAWRFLMYERTFHLALGSISFAWLLRKYVPVAGADPNGGPDGMEALASAAGVGTIPIIKLLVEAGADPNVTNTAIILLESSYCGT